MVSIDTGAALERIAGALPRALSDAFGAEVEVESLAEGRYEQLLADLGDTARVHLELDVIVARNPAYPLVLAIRFEDAPTLLRIDEVVLPEEPEQQLDLLSSLTERAETLASTLTGALSARGAHATVRMSSTSIEHAGEPAPPSDVAPEAMVAFRVTLIRLGAPPIAVVAAAAPELLRVLLTSSGAGGAPSPAPNPGRPGTAPAAPLSGGSGHGDPFAAPPESGADLTAHPFSFGQLGLPMPSMPGTRGLEPILDVPLRVRVELGSTEMLVEEVLALGVGSVVELDRLAGEPVDVVVNNRLIARGEVVVVEENFGVRITEIVRPRTRALSG